MKAGHDTQATENVIGEVRQERWRQDRKWGGAEHDDGLSVDEWHNTIADYNGWARRMAKMGSTDKARRRLIQVAALAIAAVESIDRSTMEGGEGE